MDQNLAQQSAKAQAQQKKQEEMAEQKKLMLQQCMTSEARERLSRLALVKPEKAQKIEDMIIQNASIGALKSKVDEQSLIAYLEQIDTDKPTTTIKFKRKIGDDDDDFDF